MSEFFWPAITVMTSIALVLIVRPLFTADRRIPAIVLTIAVPIFAVGVYAYFGSPAIDSGRSLPSTSANAASMSNAQDSSTEKLGSVASMLEGLSQRLAENPDDGKGWLLLARSYKHLGQIDNAIAAYTRAAALGEQDAELSTLSSAAASAVGARDSGARILGQLRLSERAAEIVLPTDTVFIFARSASGPGIPAAVLQQPASDLPINFVLDDSQSMVEGVKLSDFDEVVVTARISRSGNATEALQDLEARADSIAVQDSNQLILIIE